MSSLDLKIEIPTDALTYKFFCILRDYLQPNTTLTLHSTALSVLELLPDGHPQSMDVGFFGDTCIELAEQIPYHHPSQIKLAGLLEYVGNSEKLGRISTVQFSKSKEFHRYQLLQEHLRDSWNGADEDCPHSYVNFHAFAANLFERRILPTNPTWAIWTQREAHEGKHEDEGPMRQYYVLAAAQWILWYGQSFFKQVLFQDDEVIKDSRMWSPGPLYSGTSALSLHRWQFWKESFRTVALAGRDEEKGGYGQECRTVAAKAADIMDSLEKNMTF